MRQILLLAALSALGTSANAFGQQALLDAAYDLSRESSYLDTITRDFVDDRATKQQVEQQYQRVESALSRYRTELDQAGGGGDPSQCIQGLRNMGFSNQDAASYCNQAQPYQNQLPQCVQNLRNMGYSNQDAASTCISSRAYGQEVTTCIQSMRNMGYSNQDSATNCVNSQRFAATFTRCVQSLRNMGFSNSSSGDYCNRAGSNTGFPQCVQNLRNQGFSNDQAAANCL